MENLLQDLTKTLNKMIEIYEDILLSARDKQKHIISGDIDKLESVIYQERNLAENIFLLEKRRRYIMQSISHSFGLSEDPLITGELIDKIKDPFKSQIKKLYDIIKDVIMKVQEVNRSNTSLTKYSLEFINNFIKTICSESLDDTTYKQSGKMKEPELDRMLFEVSA